MHLVHDGHGREGHEVLESIANKLDREEEGDCLVGLPENRRVPEISQLSRKGTNESEKYLTAKTSKARA